MSEKICHKKEGDYMQEDGLFFTYVSILVLQITLIVIAALKKIRWRWPIIVELLSIVGGHILYIWYANRHPSSGYIMFDGFAESI
ncbi:MAG: hypothetical protein J6Z02_06075, partial [Lachnospiraceae bacterium]|nr:hypothetical protein [Lachnospiraceae bacterium]